MCGIVSVVQEARHRFCLGCFLLGFLELPSALLSQEESLFSLSEFTQTLEGRHDAEEDNPVFALDPTFKGQNRLFELNQSGNGEENPRQS